MVVKVTKVKNHTETDFEFTIEDFEKEVSDLKRDYKIKNITSIEELLIEKIKLFHYLEEGNGGNPLIIRDSDEEGMLIMLSGRDKNVISYLVTI